LNPIGDDRRSRFAPFVVYLLIAANLAAFVAERRSGDVGAFIDAFATIPYDITHGIVLAPPSPPIPALTIITAMFVHGGVLHVAVNLLFLLVFGPAIERRCGHLRFAALYLICGIAGGIAQVLAAANSHVPEVGASGAIAGVLGAYIVTPPVRLPAVLLIAVWAAVQFFNGFGALSAQTANEPGGTAYFTHIGGFACGVALIDLFRIRDAGTRAYRWY
jgi:membrane associated rhomboid family serine protease